MQQSQIRCECFEHKPSTFDRPVVFLPLIILMFAGFGFVVVFADEHILVELFSVLTYSAAVVLSTFSAQRGQQPYFFNCPVVRRMIPRLVQRHCGFLIALLAIEATLFFFTRYMPAPWIAVHGKDGSPFGIVLCVSCLCLAFAEILSDRVLLKRAHIQDHPKL